MLRTARALFAVLAITAALAASGCGSDAASPPGSSAASETAPAPGTTGTERTIRIGFVTTAEHPYGAALRVFARRLAAVSGGRLGAQLVPEYGGGDDLGLLADMRAGKVDAGSVSASVWQAEGVNSFLALQMPFLITTYDAERAVLASPVAALMLRGTRRVGLEGIAIHEGGMRRPASAEGCLLAPDDWTGTRMRSVQSGLLAQSIRALGADPVSMPLSDVGEALTTGRLDAIEANLGLVATLGYVDVLRCMAANVTLWPFPTVLAMNDAVWSSLTPTQKGWVRSAARVLPTASLDIVGRSAARTARELCREGGGFFFFATATPAELRALRVAVQPVYDRYTAMDGVGDLIRRVQRIVASSAPSASGPAYPASCGAG